ncbi:MAG: hypothetical protein E6706_06725 [Anaerococcus hydrogenalis]|nr:hypothetical protein [Anaerococcus hydrogenalis]
MTVYMKDYQVESKEGQVSFIDITKNVKEAIKSSCIQKGTCTVTPKRNLHSNNKSYNMFNIF